MKSFRNIVLFFVYPVVMLVTGFMCGAALVDYLNPSPGKGVLEDALREKQSVWDTPYSGLLEAEGNPSQVGGEDTEGREDAADREDAKGREDAAGGEDAKGREDAAGGEDAKGREDAAGGEDTEGREDAADREDAKGREDAAGEEESAEVSNLGQKLNAATSYVLEENDLRYNTIVETCWKLPAKYIGMNREQFLESMEVYEASPPVEELQRGFVSLEVLSFSPQKVVVRMNYQPGGSYYLLVMDNYVVVCLEDRATVYMDTEILLTDLPEDLQQEIIQGKFVPDEETLYNFLENYTS